MPHPLSPPTYIRVPALPGIPETCPSGEDTALVLFGASGALLFAVSRPGPRLPAGRAATGTGRRPHAPAPHGARHRTQSRPRRRRRRLE
jgi:hypothetical protein